MLDRRVALSWSSLRSRRPNSRPSLGEGRRVRKSGPVATDCGVYPVPPGSQRWYRTREGGSLLSLLWRWHHHAVLRCRQGAPVRSRATRCRSSTLPWFSGGVFHHQLPRCPSTCPGEGRLLRQHDHDLQRYVPLDHPRSRWRTRLIRTDGRAGIDPKDTDGNYLCRVPAARSRRKRAAAGCRWQLYIDHCPNARCGWAGVPFRSYVEAGPRRRTDRLALWGRCNRIAQGGTA